MRFGDGCYELDNYYHIVPASLPLSIVASPQEAQLSNQENSASIKISNKSICCSFDAVPVCLTTGTYNSTLLSVTIHYRFTAYN
jgi:hypothetical protein